MANSRKRISELPALTSASLDTTIVGVDNGVTYKIELDTLSDAVTSRVNILDRDRLVALEFVTSSFETKGRNVVSGSSQLTSSYDTRYTLSGSIPNIPTGSFATTGSNTFIGNQIISGSLKTNETQISLGFRAGNSTQGYGAIAIGANAATSSQGQNAIAIGIEAGEQSQGIYSVALGNGAGKIQQGQSSVSIGGSAGVQNQSPNAVAVGDRAGAYQQGSGSIAIGYKAGEFYQPNNTIIIDANGGAAAFGLTQTGSFYVSPIRNASGTDGALQYNATTREVTYSDKFENKGTGIISGSSQLNNQIITNLTITNLTTVNQTASVLYTSGSNQLGDELGDIQTLSGSVRVQGSLTINGTSVSTQSFVDVSALNSATSSYETNGRSIISSSAQITTLGFVSGSYLTSLSGAISSSTQVIGILSSLNSVSASLISKTGSYATTGSNTFYGEQIFIGNILTQSVELTPGESYGGGIVFKVVSGSYALIVDTNNLGNAQGQYLQVATNATSTTGSINQSLILSLPNIDMEDPAVMAFSSSVGGYTDWYIPSTTEIALINGGVGYQRIYEGFSTGNYYWTSNYAGSPYTYYTSDGQGRTDRVRAESYNGGSTQHPVVAIRKINRSYRELYGNANIILSGSLNVAGSITGSTNFNTIVNKPTLISGSSQLTSSFDTRYAISASFVSSSNLSSIQTITSASYAALTPVSGTLYIIIG